MMVYHRAAETKGGLVAIYDYVDVEELWRNGLGMRGRDLDAAGKWRTVDFHMFLVERW